MYTAKGQLDRNALIKQYQPLVRRLAHHMMAKLPANVQVDDLIQVGLIGLSDALSRYEAGQGAQFETFATQRIQISRQSCHQCFTFTGSHLCYLVIVQDHAADQLYVVVAHVQRAHGSLTADRKGFVKQFLKGLARGKTLLEFLGLLLELII